MDNILQGILIVAGILLGFVLYWVLRVWWINNHTEFQEYKAKFQGPYHCVDGHKVRSLSECLLDNTLYRLGIQHNYEDFIIKNLRNYKYDFFLPAYDLYIEFFGYSGQKYKATMEEKKRFYRENQLKMVYFMPEDLGEMEKNVFEKIAPFMGNDLPVGSAPNNRHCPKCGESLDVRFN